MPAAARAAAPEIGGSTSSPTPLRSAFAALAPLLAYPREDFPDPLAAARRAVGLACPEALAPFDRFAAWAAAAATTEREQAYTTTFDLSPACPPYLGVHLFAADSPERARLMVGLRQVAERAGRPGSGELPDHLAEVLEVADAFEPEEWRDLAALCLAPALAKMAAVLEPTANPYHDLLAACHRLAVAAAEAAGAADGPPSETPGGAS